MRGDDSVGCLMGALPGEALWAQPTREHCWISCCIRRTCSTVGHAARANGFRPRTSWCTTKYDNYNFLVIRYAPTERPSDAIVSMAARANGVGLCFIHGARLPDPKKVLLRSGKQSDSFASIHRSYWSAQT